MNLYSKLQQRAAEGKPIRIGLIGAGKFGSMYLAQIPRTPGVQLVGIADLSPAAAQANLARVGWPAERTQARSLDDAVKSGATHVGEDWRALVRHPAIDVIVECTGNPVAAVDHCLEAFAQRDFTPIECLPDDCLLVDYPVEVPWKTGMPASALVTSSEPIAEPRKAA